MKKAQRELVFLPGWGFQASIFTMFAEHLPEYHLHFADLPALGTTQSKMILQLAQQLPEQSTLAGWSLGGLVAIAMCVLLPHKFSGLILLGSAPSFLTDETNTRINPDTANSFLQRAENDVSATLADFIKLTCMPSYSIRRYLQSHTITNDALLLSHLQYLFATDLRTEFTSLKIPNISIAAEHDAILPPNADDGIIIANAGHAFPFTHTQQVCTLIKDFQGSA